jgi:hypothetical protein
MSMLMEFCYCDQNEKAFISLPWLSLSAENVYGFKVGVRAFNHVERLPMLCVMDEATYQELEDIQICHLVFPYDDADDDDDYRPNGDDDDDDGPEYDDDDEGR